jgi:hypothetical protein
LSDNNNNKEREVCLSLTVDIPQGAEEVALARQTLYRRAAMLLKASDPSILMSPWSISSCTFLFLEAFLALFPEEFEKVFQEHSQRSAWRRDGICFSCGKGPATRDLMCEACAQGAEDDILLYANPSGHCRTIN